MTTVVHYMIPDWDESWHPHKRDGELFGHVHADDPERAHREHHESGYVETPPRGDS